MRRLLLALLCGVTLLSLVACGDDDDAADGGGEATDDSTDEAGGEAATPEEWCDLAADEVQALEGGGDDLPDEQVMESLQSLTDQAPEQIQPDLQTITDAYDELSQVDGESFESLEQVADILLDPEFIAAFEQLGLFLETECSVDIETPSEGGSTAGPGEDEAEVQGDGNEVTQGSGFDSSALRDYLEVEDPELEARVESIASVSGLEVAVSVRQLDDPAEAVEICELVSTYVYEEAGEEDTAVVIGDVDENDLATRDGADGTCEAV